MHSKEALIIIGALKALGIIALMALLGFIMWIGMVQ